MRMRGLGWSREGEVFPGLELVTSLGTFIGAAVCGGSAWWAGRGLAVVVAEGFLGALTVGLVGAFVGVHWAVQPPRPEVDEPTPPQGDRLWDPWVDHGEIPQPAPDVVAAAPALVAERAPVRPRVLTAEGETLPLEDEIWPFLKAGDCGAIRIWGADGSGKSAALRHLAAVFPPLARATVLDDRPDATMVAPAAARGLAIYASPAASYPKHIAAFVLAPWGDDELIEYLLAVDKPRCGSVMKRLKASSDRGFLRGIPDLWRVVLDRMAADDAVEDFRQALRLEVAERLPDPAQRDRLQSACLANLSSEPSTVAKVIASEIHDDVILRWTRYVPVRVLLAADQVVTELGTFGYCAYLALRLPRQLVEEAARRITDDRLAERVLTLERLHQLVEGEDRAPHPMAASLLLAVKGSWRPDSAHVPRLEGAYLDRALWTGLDLTDAVLANASMVRADLSRATLDRADLTSACLHRARFCEASLRGSNLAKTDLSEADLSSCVGDCCLFGSANLTGAVLANALLRNAVFWHAKLNQAVLRGAHLAGAEFEGADIEGADFTRANLEGARLQNLRLCGAFLTGARFAGADLTGCDLEGMELRAADFEDAVLAKTLMTGTKMPRANFLGADLRDAGLAEIDWPDACLRDADLRGATFHLGSTRSGLIGSPIACEGSRTGFYTDDYLDQDHRPPEEIRKANLCGADLRGADLEGVDFYLVDLRGARFDAEQAEHFRQCRAILDAYV